MRCAKLFIHGLESSARGTKGSFFSHHFKEMMVPDFHGDLSERMTKLVEICCNCQQIIIVGSSFGGLMATCFALQNPEMVKGLILLAPALNFGDFKPPVEKSNVPVQIVIGDQDVVTPAEIVLPLAHRTFTDPHVTLLKGEDHFLKGGFLEMDWHQLLNCTNNSVKGSYLK